MLELLADATQDINVIAVARYLRDLQAEIYLLNSEDHLNNIHYQRGAIQQAQRADVHTMTVPEHMITVGTLATDILNVRVANFSRTDLPGEVHEIFGLNQDYLTELRACTSRDTEENRPYGDLYTQFKHCIEVYQLNEEDRVAGTLIAYLHDYEKLFAEQLNNTIVTSHGFVKAGRFTNVAFGIIDPDSMDAVDSQSKLTLNLFRNLADEEFISTNLLQRLISIYSNYLGLTNYVKGYTDRLSTLPLEDKDQILALVLLFSDELGKGIEFQDQSYGAMTRRHGKLDRLRIILDRINL
jgi:hypothetical protein